MCLTSGLELFNSSVFQWGVNLDLGPMERIPEPELMTDAEQALAYAGADFEEPHQHFIDLLCASLPDLSAVGMALDLGCGPADITLRFAHAFPDWWVDGLDGSEAMLYHGWVAIQKAHLHNRVSLHHSYLPDGDAPQDRYDLIFSNSLLHHLADPMALWASIRRWASRGSAVFVMDLMRPQSRTAAAQLVNQYAENEPQVLQRDFLNSLLAAYSVEEVNAQLTEVDLDSLEVKPVSDRHFIVWGHP